MEKRSTRERLLDAGLSILLEEPDLVLLKASRVARRAHVTTGAFFHYWPTQDDFVNELLDYSLVDQRLHTVDVVTEMLQPLLEKATTQEEREEAIREASQKGLEHITKSPAVALQMAVWSKHLNDEEARNRLRDVYRRLDGQFLSLYTKILQDWGYEPQDPPYKWDRIAAILTAVVDGFAIRRAVDPDILPDEDRILGNVILALLPVMTRSAAEGV
jgi:AcrR family transcriptional regulator